MTPTKTMAGRAQRGRWMKTDPEPDLEIPMMIDFIKVPNQIDDAIRTSYGGGRPNPGYFIDCDGTILEQLDWAWADPEADAGGRSQHDFEDLAGMLDAYLDRPSGCYTNVMPELTPTPILTATQTPTTAPSATTVPTLIVLPDPSHTSSPSPIPPDSSLYLPILRG